LKSSNAATYTFPHCGNARVAGFAASVGETRMRIIACNITPLPKTFRDPLPLVEVTLENGETKTLFDYYPDEIAFEPREFVGLTVAEAMRLKSEKDLAYLRS
jgi:hypothetical protein